MDGAKTVKSDLPSDVVASVRDLRVEFNTPLGTVTALSGVSFDIPKGKVLGIVGESGCGKSVTSRTMLGILEKAGKVTDGEILFRPERRTRLGNGSTESQQASGTEEVVELTSMPKDSPEIRSIRGSEIAMIFQEPMTSLNPVYTVGNQITEAILLHQTKDKSEAYKLALDILQRVGMPNPERVAESFPHQLSGGMRQRAMIAMALSCAPTLLIADEPTTALDVTTEAQILELMRELQQASGMSIMFITHSMGVIAQLADEVAVMYLGQVVEHGPVEEIFYNPKHPYTIQLLRSIPRLGVGKGEPLEVIKGSIPDPYSTVSGCPFHPRCPNVMDVCKTTMPRQVRPEGDDHSVRCHLYPGSAPSGTDSSTERTEAAQ